MVTCTPMKIDRNNYEGVIALFEIVNIDKGEPWEFGPVFNCGVRYIFSNFFRI